MNSDYNDIGNNSVISIKQKIRDSINIDFYDYIRKKINKNVEDCNLLYTQVCYLIKLFLLYEFENDININYDLNEIFIRFCFKLIRNRKEEYILNDSDEKDNIKVRLVNFYNDFNTKNASFICPNNLDSVSHITNAISRDIATNIKNNIVINFYKYLNQYIKINLKLEFENTNFEISSKIVKSVYNDIMCNTFYSNCIFHKWIIKNKKLIIPNFDNDIIQINSIQDGITKYNKILKPFIEKYIKNNELLHQMCNLNNIKKTDIKAIHDSIYNDIISNTYFKTDLIFHNWIKDNIFLIINNFNSINYIDIVSKVTNEPFLFLHNMLFMNKNLELNKSKKHYQIIPLRTNMSPKFIPINTHALVDILDSKYLDNVKNYYHNNTSNGIVVWNKYFLFSSAFIKSTIKKGFIFSGLIQTNGNEIIFTFYSKKYNDSKNNFHSSGKKEIKNIKELIKDLPESEKEEFKKSYDLQKKQDKDLKKELDKENFKKKKEDEKNLKNENIENIKTELDNLESIYKKECEKLNKIYSNSSSDYETEKYKSSMAYVTHCFNRDKQSLIDDYTNNIDEMYKQIIIEDDIINKKIDEIKINLNHKKNELKKIKFKRLKDDKYIKKCKSINEIIDIEKNTLVKIINKIRIKRDLLNYECEDKTITKSHIDIIKKTLFNLINKHEKIKNIFLNISNISIIKQETEEVKIIIDKVISIFIEEIKLEKYKKIEIKNINIKNNEEYLLQYNKILEEIKEISKNLCKQLDIKKRHDKKLRDLFKTKDNEYMKIDTMSKNYLNVVDGLNWCVIDPGVGTLFCILSKDGKTRYNYTKKFHNNRVSFNKINKKIIKIKQEKITQIENDLSKEDIRLKTSNNYETFKLYYTRKMLIHKELETLYNDERLNKLKWNLFVNEKRAENMIINDIKKKFGEDVVLILGDWSMDKKIIKGISSTPNKKYTRILENSFITLQINEYITSIIHNKLEKKCENYINKYNRKYKKIKSVYLLEKLKTEDSDKYKKIIKDKKIHKILVCKTNEKLNEYVDRDKNSTKNMKNIVLSYINTNYRPKQFVMGTKICKHSLMVL